VQALEAVAGAPSCSHSPRVHLPLLYYRSSGGLAPGIGRGKWGGTHGAAAASICSASGSVAEVMEGQERFGRRSGALGGSGAPV
jgi:hypothetical protein